MLRMTGPSIALLFAGVALAVPVAGWQPSNAASAVAPQSPQAVLDGLLAEERALSDAAATLSPAEGLASLMADDVAALKQVLRTANDAEAPQQTPALPATLVPADPARTAEHRRTLIAAEKAFSDRAQTVGIKQSFQEYGRPDAIHLFGPTGFAIGLPAIGANHDQQPAGPATSHWSANTAVVASSGDLGVTIGSIRSNGPPPEGQPAEVPFFTIWRRDNPSQPWRYIAE
jgi:hypothetical protein